MIQNVVWFLLAGRGSTNFPVFLGIQRSISTKIYQMHRIRERCNICTTCFDFDPALDASCPPTASASPPLNCLLTRMLFYISQVWDFPPQLCARLPHARANMIHSVGGGMDASAESKSELEFARSVARAAPRKILAHNETLNTDLNFTIIIINPLAHWGHMGIGHGPGGAGIVGMRLMCLSDILFYFLECKTKV